MMRLILFVLTTLAFWAPVSSLHADEALRLATTTSTENSGLLGHLLPKAEGKLGFKVHVIAVGSGKALKLGENGDVDVVLSHAPELEEKFIAAGWGVDRRAVMYNDFVLVGPDSDPAGVRQAVSTADALRRIARGRHRFISRGDESGTHQKEKSLWREAGIDPQGEWYVSAGRGQSGALLMADEKQGYTLSDRGTYLTFQQRAELPILFQADAVLMNPYTMMAVNPARHPHAQYERAKALLDWFTSEEGRHLIAEFKVNGQVLFHPGAPPR
jgi:tungstate transport system substrate-binding protein